MTGFGSVPSLTTSVEEHRAIAAIDPEAAASALEHVLATGDLAQFSPKQRIGYYLYLCQKLGIDSEQRPFDWLTLDGRLVFYPNKNCAEQLRRKHQISVELVRKETTGDYFVVEVKGSRPNGQQDFASKYVSLRDARGNRLAGRQYENALHKAETGAKRRLTFSLVGLSAAPDLEDLSRARVVTVDGYGNVLADPTDAERHLAERPAVARVIGEPTYETTATAADAPVSGGVSQAPTTAEAQQPKRSGPRPTLRPTDADVKRWRDTYFATTTGTSLSGDEGRHTFVRQWCSQYPDGIRTESLTEFLQHATARQAEDLLAHVRALADDERLAAEEALAEHREATAPVPEDDGGAF